MTPPNASKPSFSHASIVCFVSAIFFLYEFALQISPGVMTNDIMRDLAIDAAQLGALSSAYYVAYTFMQIPAGLLYDRFGPRVLLTFASLICAAGSLAFGMTHGVFGASSGRFLMGIGSAFAFIGTLVLISRWFPPAYFAFLAGILQLMGSAGTLIGGMPLAVTVEHFGWRETIVAAAFIGLFVAALIWFVVRDAPEGSSKYADHPHASEGEIKRLFRLCRDKQVWLVGLYAFTSWTPMLVLGGLWAVPYLMAVYGIDTPEASGIVSMVWISVAIGSPLVGWWSDRIGNRCIPLAMCSLVGLISLLLILYCPNIPLGLMFVLFFFFGFAASAQTLSFALVKDNNHPAMVGTAIGFNNMMVVAGGLIQFVVGYLLRMNWGGEMADGVPVYSAANYRIALMVLPVCFALGLLLSLKFLRESHCKPVYYS